MAVDLSVWNIADPLTVDQAACLWAGVDPSTFYLTRANADQTRVEAYKQAIAGAIAKREVTGDSSTNALAMIGNHDKTLVSRLELKRFAESKGQRPAFLFDTLLGGMTALAIALAASVPVVPQMTAVEPVSPLAKGGRPQEYDWDAFTIEIIRIADLDSLPEKQAHLVSLMLEWCQATWGKEPAESSVKKRISTIYSGLGRGQKLNAP